MMKEGNTPENFNSLSWKGKPCQSLILSGPYQLLSLLPLYSENKDNGTQLIYGKKKITLKL